MPYIWVSTGHWEIMFSIEYKLCFYELKRLSADFTCDSPVEYIIRDIGYVFWKLTRRNSFCNDWRWWYKVRPTVPLSKCLISREWKALVCLRLIVRKSTQRDRKERSPFSSLLHMVDDLCHLGLVCLR